MKTLICIIDGCGNITFRNPDAEYGEVAREAASIAVHAWEVFLLHDFIGNGLFKVDAAWHRGKRYDRPGAIYSPKHPLQVREQGYHRLAWLEEYARGEAVRKLTAELEADDDEAFAARTARYGSCADDMAESRYHAGREEK